ncbi:MAG TPA: hypothetical protein VGM44_24475 [Polyangiaceae bacterium]|jgi:hypothetical protein
MQPSRLLFWGALIALAFPAACGSSGVVGGECRASFIDCNGRCVDAQSDPDNCGACAHQCDDGVVCESAICGGFPDGSAGAAGSSSSAGSAGTNGVAGEAGEGNVGDGGPNGGSQNGDAGDSGPSDASHDGDASCGPPPYDRPEACGDCATQCTGNTPICSPDGMGSFTCVLKCDPPLVLCGNQCVDLNIDPLHCGSCPNVCPSGICQGGKCVGANVGHVVLACMDYSTPVAGTPQTVLMENSVFLPIRNPVRILTYIEFAPANARAKVNQDITFAANARGRTFTMTTSAAYADVTAKLNVNDFDVFLIYDQSSAPAGQLATVGSAWQTSTVLSSFAAAGGVIVALSGGTGTGEMGQLFTNSELLDVSAETSVSGQTLYNRAPADVIGVNVISPFLAPKNSCTFTTSATQDSDNVFVIRDAASPAVGSPVVVHRVIEP